MPTNTNVTNLKINTLTKAQYDTAVQGGVIGANEISIITDLEDSIQVSTMPTATAGEEGNIYQFVGATDASYTNGYFYKCVSDGQNPATYSWANIQVQASSGGLPSQTGNAGKFLTTDGTDASWSDKPLVNRSTGNQSVIIGDSTMVNSNTANVLVGWNTRSYGNYSVRLGSFGLDRGNYNTSVGVYHDINANVYGTINLGYACTATTSQTLNVRFPGNTGDTGSTSQYELLSSDGTIPTARLTKVNSTITLTAAGWSGGSQTVTVTGITATGVVLVSPDPTDQSAYTSAGILCTAQAAGTLTFTCSTTPTADIDVSVVML